MDGLDIWIPATNLGIANFNDGTLGIFGFVRVFFTLFGMLIYVADSLHPSWPLVNCGKLRQGENDFRGCASMRIL
jgi:hypothetical protein